jgi:hypothetical protein
MYEVIRRPVSLDDGQETEALDVLGLGATLTHHVTGHDPESPGSLYVRSKQAWFDSVWHHLTTS